MDLENSSSASKQPTPQKGYNGFIIGFGSALLTAAWLYTSHVIGPLYGALQEARDEIAQRHVRNPATETAPFTIEKDGRLYTIVPHKVEDEHNTTFDFQARRPRLPLRGSPQVTDSDQATLPLCPGKPPQDCGLN